MTDPVSIATGLCLVGLVAVLLLSVRRGNAPATANALVSLAVVGVPFALAAVASALGRDPTVGRALTAWLAVAGLLHSVGMLGPYDRIAWWDGLTHAVSAGLVAALLYAAALVAAGHAGVGESRPAAAVVTLALTALAGVFWELIEIVARDLGEATGLEPVLVHYGLRDTAVDLAVDLLAAAVVVGVDLRLFVSLVRPAPALTTGLLAGAAGVLAVGSLGLAATARHTTARG